MNFSETDNSAAGMHGQDGRGVFLSAVCASSETAKHTTKHRTHSGGWNGPRQNHTEEPMCAAKKNGKTILAK
jgi:hypothetical protein